jgi:hypothetical protein
MLIRAEREGRTLAGEVLKESGSPRLRAQLFLRAAEQRFASQKLSPRDYLGNSCTPGTPENLALRKMAKKVFEEAVGEKLD